MSGPVPIPTNRDKAAENRPVGGGLSGVTPHSVTSQHLYRPSYKVDFLIIVETVVEQRRIAGKTRRKPLSRSSHGLRKGNCVSLLDSTTVSGRTVYIVGDSAGWNGGNVDYHMWGSTKTFQVGDTLGKFD
ncbi:hypothetical protein RND71_027661 [Anisodus tanguticus]|uniref:Phytocyanin domain-containing protein n=1 Tax=Anisodus tanguticus TaxID=243964 RepID=A0AAE1RJP4_9SOLA|nr:hypothetical protein RND71_027661 [Anisodus tanguticus]